MAYNLIECNREQMYLMPVNLQDWLSEGHLGAWVTTRQQDSYLGCRLIFLSAWLWAILGASVAQIGVTNDLHRV
jgi:hypothetical protein